MPYCPIVGTLGFVLSPDGTKVLLCHRNARECMRRELLEEADITPTELVLRGTVNWTGFGPKGEDWLGFIFRIDAFEGAPHRENEEGVLEWHPLGALETLPMWEGDRHFLPMIFDQDPRVFHGMMPYENDRPLSWSYVRI
jgi:8-oxo-dGTP diphosphatase